MQHDRPACSIRPATAADRPFLEEMLAVAADWRSGTPRRSVAEVLADPRLAHYVAGWPRPGEAGVVAEVDELVGAAWWRCFPADDPGYGFVAADVPEIAVGVREGWRGRGIGRELLVALVDLARTGGIAALSLSVEADNPAVRLYERLGFQPVGGASDALTMQLRLRGRTFRTS